MTTKFIILIAVVIFAAFQIMNLVKGQELSPPLSEEEEKYCESRYGDNITRCVAILDRMTPEERQYCDGSYQDYEDAGMNVICPPFLSKSLELDKEKEGKEPLGGIITDMKNMSGSTAEDKKQLVGNVYFSIKLPDNWAYIESSNTPEAKTTGYGTVNTIELTPSEFSDILSTRDYEKLNEKIQDGGAYGIFLQDTDYPKNALLESYAKYQIDNYGISNITSQQNTTVGNEKSVRIYANETAFYGNNKIALYLVMHDKVPYLIAYVANAKNYEKYLPEFEQMIKSFRFVGSPSSEMENENNTNTATNFSSANLTELSTRDTTNNQTQEELYIECVNVAGKSLCDTLFKR
jgi:hypothetical protein